MSDLPCPVCSTPSPEQESGNGGHLYVAEDFDDCTESFDSDISYHKCPNGHTFYVTKKDEG